MKMNVRRWLIGGTVALALGSWLACDSPERKPKESPCVTVTHHGSNGVDVKKCPPRASR